MTFPLRKSEFIGGEIPKLRGCFHDLAARVGSGELYRGADIGRHAARIGAVIERRQLGVGDDDYELC